MNSTETSRDAFLGRIFGQSYKPDILQCLANLSSDEVFTPPEVVNAMLDMLPSEIWQNPNLKFLDPACKTGVFLREITKRLIKGLEKEIPDLQKRIDHILRNMVYGIAITNLTSLVARRSLYCTKDASSKYSISAFENPEGNVAFENMRHTWEGGKCVYCGASQAEYDRDESLEQHAYQFIHIKNPEEIFNMKFDVIIGNPPYQMSDGGNGASAKPIYQYFVEQAKKLNPRYLSMIIPARWYAGGKGLDEFRDRMINSKNIKELHDFQNSQDCFPGAVSIEGGVCYFLLDENYIGKCEIYTHEKEVILSKSKRFLKEDGDDIFIRMNEAISIINKIKKLKEPSLAEGISSRKPFGFSTNFRGDKESGVLCYQNGGVSFVGIGEIKKGEHLIDKYKVIISKAYGSGNKPYKVLNDPILAEKNSCCTETYIVIRAFENLTEAKNLISYIKTKFFRFLVLLRKNTQDATAKVYQFVPIQDFSKPWTDEELYEKYGLSEEEIKFIEENIKPME